MTNAWHDLWKPLLNALHVPWLLIQYWIFRVNLGLVRRNLELYQVGRELGFPHLASKPLRLALGSVLLCLFAAWGFGMIFYQWAGWPK